MTLPPAAPSPARPPSTARVAVTVLLAVFALPLAPVAWVLMSGAERAGYLRSWLVRIGLGLMVVGPLPLVGLLWAVAAGLSADPSPNPIGLGLFFLAAEAIGFILLSVGVVVVGRS